MPEGQPSVLAILNRRESCRACELVLGGQDYRVVVCQDGLEGVAKFRDDRPDAVLVDHLMSGLGGHDIVDRLRQIDPSVPAIMFTRQPSLESAMAAIKSGAFDFLPLPFTPDELVKAVGKAVAKHRELQETERLLREKETLERNFITFVTHQLRSPLVAMAQFFEVLISGAAGECSDKQRAIIDKLYARLQDMLELINNWLDLSRVKAGIIVDRLEPISARELIDRSVETHRPLAEAGGARLIWRPPEYDLTIMADRESLGQAVANLIANAIKYAGKEGVVELALRAQGDQAALIVSDNGPGIPAEFIPFLFDEFSRAKGQDKKNIGSGLGLALANRIVIEHGGTIKVVSQPGHGATFTLLVPLANQD